MIVFKKKSNVFEIKFLKIKVNNFKLNKKSNKNNYPNF